MIRRRRLLIAAAAAACLPAMARAQESGGPAAPILALDEALQAVRKAGRATPFAQRAATMSPVVTSSFALDDVLRASVGPRYAALPADQKTTLLQVFTDYTVASYVANFDTNSGDKFVVDQQTRPVGADQVVSTRIVPAKGTPTRLDYVVRQDGAAWRIVDVLIDGSISQVAVQRSDFRSLLSANSAERLIASLRAKTASLAAGGKV